MKLDWLENLAGRRAKKMWKSIIASLVSLTVLGCASVSGVNPESLQEPVPSYFELTKTFESKSYDVRNSFGSVGPAFNSLCQGKYIAWKSDADGTFFAWPENCVVNGPGGIWVAHAGPEAGAQMWVTNVKPSNLNSSQGLIVDAFVNWETGRIRKSGLIIQSKEVLEMIRVKALSGDDSRINQ